MCVSVSESVFFDLSCHGAERKYRVNGQLLRRADLLRLHFDASSIILFGLELVRSSADFPEFTSRFTLNIPPLAIKFEDFSLLRLDAQDMFFSKEVNYLLPGVLARHQPNSPIEKFMFNSNYRVIDATRQSTGVTSRTHFFKQYLYSSELPKYNHLVELNETISNRSQRKLDASAKLQAKLFYSGQRGQLTGFDHRLNGEISIGQLRIDKYRQMTSGDLGTVAKRLAPTRMLVSVHKE